MNIIEKLITFKQKSKLCLGINSSPNNSEKCHEENMLILPPNHAARGQFQGEDIQIKESSPVILVYQMGKVGSSSIYKTLDGSEQNIPVYHVHYLSTKRLQKSITWHEQNNFPCLVDHLVISSALNTFLANHKNDINWKIISLVRDPISLEASGIFQNVQEAYPEIIDQRSNSLDLEKTQQLLEQRLSHHATDKYHFLNWFDCELKSAFDIDIYSHPFDKQKGYEIISENNIDILLIKLEKLQNCFNDAMRDFLGMGHLHLYKANVGTQKEYGGDYSTFIQQLKVSEKLFKNVYNAKLVKHFYTQKEIEQFKTKWT